MRIERRFQPSCSEYTLRVSNISDEAYFSIQTLREDMIEAENKCNEIRLSAPEEPLFSFDDNNDEWSEWYNSPKYQEIVKKTDEIWKEMNAKYNDMFDTTIYSWQWNGRELRIDGYLNEDNLVEWLKKLGCDVKIDGGCDL